jgi:osmotically-inducible protein OsmY
LNHLRNVESFPIGVLRDLRSTTESVSQDDFTLTGSANRRKKHSFIAGDRDFVVLPWFEAERAGQSAAAAFQNLEVQADLLQELSVSFKAQLEIAQLSDKDKQNYASISSTNSIASGNAAAAESGGSKPIGQRNESLDSAKRTDDQTEAAVRSALTSNPLFHTGNLHVTVENRVARLSGSVATLAGTVKSYAEKLAAEKNAYDGGAKHVINNLRVLNRST